MTGAWDVYKKDGTFRRSGNVVLDTGSDEDFTDIITGVSGKRIVPAWAYVMYEGGSGLVTWSLVGSSSNYVVFRASSQASYHDRRMYDFGGQELMTLADGETLQFVFHDSTGLVVTDNMAHCAVGYYLVDA